MLADLLRTRGVELTFTMIEIGAAPRMQDGQNSGPEPFYRILEAFPSSRVIAFEVDPGLCRELNAKSPPQVQFYAQALGRRSETRDFYLAEFSQCSSLYPPNQALCDLYQNLGNLVRTRSRTTLETVALDEFLSSQAIGAVDFIKIDIQGAELEVFEGGTRALANVLGIVSEVEFEPIYVGQPLYEDVTAFLRSRGFQLHKFLGLSGRALQPMVINGDVNLRMQDLWADALYVRDLLRLEALSADQLLKLALIAECYGSVDLSHHLLAHHDRRQGGALAPLYLERLLHPAARP